MATTARRCGQGAAKPGCGELQDRPHPCTAVSTPSVKRGLHGTHDAQEGRHREGDGVAGGWRRATAGKEATQRGYGHGSKGSATPESSSELISFSNKTSHPFARSGSGQAQDGALGKHEREETSLVLPPGALSPRVLHTAPPPAGTLAETSRRIARPSRGRGRPPQGRHRAAASRVSTCRDTCEFHREQRRYHFNLYFL